MSRSGMAPLCHSGELQGASLKTPKQQRCKLPTTHHHRRHPTRQLQHRQCCSLLLLLWWSLLQLQVLLMQLPVTSSCGVSMWCQSTKAQGAANAQTRHPQTRHCVPLTTIETRQRLPVGWAMPSCGTHRPAAPSLGFLSCGATESRPPFATFGEPQACSSWPSGGWCTSGDSREGGQPAIIRTPVAHCSTSSSTHMQTYSQLFLEVLVLQVVGSKLEARAVLNDGTANDVKVEHALGCVMQSSL